MYDARTFPKSLEQAKEILKKKGASFAGYYEITDRIYISKDKAQGIDKVFLRLRSVPVNIWSDKQYVVVIKNTELAGVGKQSIIPIKEQFDTKEEAELFVNTHYKDVFDFAFEFDRIGWKYFIGEDGIDLEEIEGHPSIEYKSKTEEGLRELLQTFSVSDTEVIKGPSVMVVQNMLHHWRSA